MASLTTGIKGGDKAQQGLKAEKIAKFRLSKEQTQFVTTFVALDNRIVTCREYIAMWMNFFRFFAEDLTDKEITPEEEKGFFQISTHLARKHFTFVELMGGTFERGNDVINLLCTAVSLSNIQAMQENTRSKLELDWHSLFLEMNKALGRLIRLLPGNMPLSEALASMDKISPLGAKPLAPGQAASAKKAKPAHSKVVAALLALPPMGVLGLDCFYLGLTKKGILRIVTLGGLGLWCLIDFVRILAGKVDDAQGQTLS